MFAPGSVHDRSFRKVRAPPQYLRLLFLRPPDTEPGNFPDFVSHQGRARSTKGEGEREGEEEEKEAAAAVNSKALGNSPRASAWPPHFPTRVERSSRLLPPLPLKDSEKCYGLNPIRTDEEKF